MPNSDKQELLEFAKVSKEDESEDDQYEDLLDSMLDEKEQQSTALISSAVKGMKDPELNQWGKFGASWSGCGITQEALPAGVYSCFQNNQGQLFWTKQNLTTDNLLRLPDSKSDMVISEIERFWTLKEKFKSFGFSHKRGFLLWGPQGGGKTSTLSIVTKQMVESGGLVLLATNAPAIISAALKQLRKVEPERPIVVLMEDIDAIIRQHDEASVLSLLDGEDSISNVVFIATTNYPEKLEARISNRPSRFDRVVKIGMPTPEARKIYLESRNINLSPAEMAEWVKKTDNLSIAHLKEVVVSVLCYEVPLDDAVDRVRVMAKIPKSSEDVQISLGSGVSLKS